jgi:hypothetical protein
MRMHQRVGRLHRYGQANEVDVVILHNPDTVEGRLWAILEEKLQRITLAFRGAMDDPEDMRQLVLGMVSKGLFERMFADAPSVPGDRLESWFDAQTGTLGGRDAITAVERLIGNAARFDFQEAKVDLPKVDLPDLAPFFKAMLRYRGRRADERDTGLSFVTPEEWKTDFVIQERYQGMLFERTKEPSVLERVIGAGHRLFETVVVDAEGIEHSVAAIPGLEEAIIVWAIRDEITETSRIVQRAVCATVGKLGAWRLLADWEVVRLLNQQLSRPERRKSVVQPDNTESAFEAVREASSWLGPNIAQLNLPFRRPTITLHTVLWPSLEKKEAEDGPLGPGG